MKRFIVVLALSLLSFPSFADVVITHGSSGGVFTQNNGAQTTNFANFDRAEFTFAAEFADTITIANTGNSAFAHIHSGVRFAEVDVFDGANWINVFSSAIPGSIPLSNLFATPIVFAGLSISGLRIDVDFPVRQAYHRVSGAMTYTTSGVADTDGDGVDDNADLCPGTAAAAAVDTNGCSDAQVDGDGDGVCDAGAPSDGPSACTGTDNCPVNSNPLQEDNDNDGIGDACDDDDDNDGVPDDVDNCPLTANTNQDDFDGDGLGDVCDPDDDNDNVLDGADVCPVTNLPESVPTSGELNPNHWALIDGDFSFDTVSKGKGKGPGRSYTTTDTAGCSCEQIIEVQDLGDGHSKHGCSISAMDDWLAAQ